MNAVIVAESSLLMWLLAGGLLALSFVVALGWLQVAQRRLGGGRGWARAAAPLALAAMALGAGCNGALLLSLSAQALSFEIGFRLLAVFALWPAAMLLCALPLALLARWPGRWVRLAAAALLAAIVVALGAGWLLGAGLKPGNWWRATWLVAAFVLGTVGLAAGLTLVQSEVFRSSDRKRAWRAAAMLVLAATVFAAQELVFLGALLHEQAGSAWARVVPLTVLSIVCGVLLPLAMAMMWADLVLRRRDGRERRRGGSAHLAVAADAAEARRTRRGPRRRKARVL